jgi:hypothetical protein
MTFGWAGGYAEVGNMAKTPTVKCMATGVQGPRDQFYKAPNNRYFQSEAVYQAWLAGRRKEKAKKNKPKPQKKPGRTTESYKKLCDTIANLIGYDPDGGQPMPTIVFRRLKELDFYSDEIIQETFDEKASYIRWVFRTKEFQNDAGKVSYMMAIIQNSIAEVYRREKEKTEKSVKEQSRSDLDAMVDLSSIGVVHKGNDVSSLLGGDDLWT